MNTSSLRHSAGNLLVVGLEGLALSGLERAWLKTVRPGGVILFRRNISDAAQTRALLADAASLCAPHAFRCVDVEGGTVDRLRHALAHMPAPENVAAAHRKTSAAPSRAAKASPRSAPSLAYEHGVLTARGIKAFGFNVTLAPVLDLALPESNGVMGSRAAGVTAEDVIAFAREFLAGLASEGVAGCGKHFPGLGGGVNDSHIDTPRIARPWRDLWREDLAPYRELRTELPMVMVSHAAYPLTPGKDVPATASPFWITKTLRGRIGYRGLIFSDDLEMGGILKFMSIEDAAIAAIRAGMDTLEICHSPELILRAYEAILSEAERSAAFRKILEARAKDTARKRARMFASGVPRALTERQFEVLRGRILRFRQTVNSMVGEADQPARNATPVETA
ncbi:MAG: beta-N-acetylhexosaminidase [Acidobacteriota bacterium]